MSSSAEFHSGFASPRNKVKFRQPPRSARDGNRFIPHSQITTSSAQGIPRLRFCRGKAGSRCWKRRRYLSAGVGGDGQAVGQQPSRLVLFDQLYGNHRDHNLEDKKRMHRDGQGRPRRQLREFLSQGGDLTIIITPREGRRCSISLFFIKGHGIPPMLISAQRRFLFDQNNTDRGNVSSGESPIARAPPANQGSVKYQAGFNL